MKIETFSNNEMELEVLNNENKEVVFSARSIAKCLGYRDAYNVARVIDEEDKGTHKVSTLGGEQEILTVNESGLYTAILKSNKPESKRFKRWVTAEILPSIRKYGCYGKSIASASCSQDNATTLKEVMQMLLKFQYVQNELLLEKRALEEYLEAKKNDIFFAEIIKAQCASLTVDAYAKLLSNKNLTIGRGKLFGWFRDNGYFLTNNNQITVPLQKYIDNGLFEVSMAPKKGDLNNKTKLVILVTPKGQISLASKIFDSFTRSNKDSISVFQEKSIASSTDFTYDIKTLDIYENDEIPF